MENFKIIDLKINKPIQFMNDKMFFVGKITKTGNNFLEVTISNLQDNLKIFNINETADFFIVFEEEAYWCNSKVIRCTTDNYSQLIILEQPKIINKIKRRKFQNLKVISDIEYCLLPNNVDELSKVTHEYKRIRKKTVIIDINGSEITLLTYEKIESGKLVFLSFKIKENIISVCSVARSETNEDDTNFKTAVKFVDIDVEHQNIINEYISEKVKSN